ncbi:MAG: 2-hydroxyacyl-CoA dehydratase family protein [Thermodesulfobacteriota bacterium]
MKSEEFFSRVAADPLEEGVAHASSTGRAIVGYACTYAPVEIIHAAGALPFRIPMRSGAGSNLSDRHLQPYCCGFAKGILDDALSGRLDFLDVMVFPHTCDTMQRLSDIWRVNRLPGKHIDVDLPAVLTTPAARSYTESLFRSFAATLSGHVGGTLDEERLRKATVLYNRIRKRLRTVVKGRNEGRIRAFGEEIADVLKAAWVLDPEMLLERLDTWIRERAVAEPSARTSDRRAVVVSGSQCAFSDLYRIVEDAGGCVVADDSCTGMRNMGGAVEESGDMMANLAAWYLERVPCPAKHRGLDARSDHLKDLVREFGAAGVVFVHLKFCDPHGFDYPDIKAKLDRAGIPSLRIEIDEGMIGEGQVATRIQAFLETLSG